MEASSHVREKSGRFGFKPRESVTPGPPKHELVRNQLISRYLKAGLSSKITVSWRDALEPTWVYAIKTPSESVENEGKKELIFRKRGRTWVYKCSVGTENKNAQHQSAEGLHTAFKDSE